MFGWKDPADDAKGRLRTTSQAESTSAPETIENQQRSAIRYHTFIVRRDRPESKR